MERRHGPSSTVLVLATALFVLGLILVLVAAGTGAVVLTVVLAPLCLLPVAFLPSPLAAPRLFVLLRAASPRAPPRS